MYVFSLHSDYAEPFEKTRSELMYLLQRRGYEPEVSFGAFSGDRLVSFVLNGK